MSIFNDAEHWRTRAREARMQAEQMQDEESKRAMLGIAAGYDRLAERADMRVAKDPPQLK
jgi:hypothetical protein